MVKIKGKVITKIEELEEFIKSFGENNFRYKDDEIFLLPIEEYEKHKDILDKYCMKVRNWWWMRSCSNDSVHYYSLNTDDIYDYACPAFKFIHDSRVKIGEFKVIFNNFIAVKIAEGKQYDLYLLDISLFWDKFNEEE